MSGNWRATWTLSGLLATLLFSMLGQAHAAGDIDVRVEPFFGGSGSHGYSEYAALVTNRSTQKGHEVTLKIPAQPYGRLNGWGDVDAIRSVTRTVTVRPEETVRVALFVPEGAIIVAGDGMGLWVDGRETEERFAVPIELARQGSRLQRFSGADPPLVLVGTRVANDFVDRMKVGGVRPFVGPLQDDDDPDLPRDFPARDRPGARNRRGGIALDDDGPPGFVDNGVEFGQRGAPILLWFWRADAPIQAWSPNWLAYSRYHGIAVTSDDLRAAPGPVRRALTQFVEIGGVLIVLGSSPELAQAWRHEKAGGFTVAYGGFGKCIIDESGDYERWDHSQWEYVVATLIESVHTTNLDAPSLVAGSLAGGDVRLPVRGLLILMFLFAIVIGPVNLYVLARMRRRIWMLWTVPTFSLITCLAVFGYMIVAEGWGGHLGIETVTILNEGTGRATTIGHVGIYTPLTPSDGLHFSYDTEVTSAFEADRFSIRRSRGTSRTIDWSRDQHLAQGWVQPRVPTNFQVRKIEARREQLTFHRGKDGVLTVANGLGAPIKHLQYADEQGAIYAASDVPAGGEAALAPTSAQPVGVRANVSIRTVFHANWFSTIRLLRDNGLNYLVRNSYIAVLDSNPFFEEPLREASKNSFGIVYGLQKGVDHEN